MSAAGFAKAVDRLLTQVSHWEQPRWAAGDPTRADLVFGLVQRLADLGADVEGRERRAVPRLSDLILRDQVRVMADDLLAGAGAGAGAGAADDRLGQATVEVDALRRSL